MSNPADEKIKALNPPDQPGVYIMHDASDKIIYIGKANSLKHRLNSYRRPLPSLDHKTQALVVKIHWIETVVTDSTMDALMLEYNLIKKHRPRYNIIMRDDKSYPYLKITNDHFFPRLVVTRQPFVDKGTYYGPYIGVPLKQIARELSFAFKLCIKKIPLEITKNEKRGCLYYQMGQCSGVCLQKISYQDYMKQVRQLRSFLDGRQDKVTPGLRKKMNHAAAKMDYEQAAIIRDQLDHLEQIRNLPAVTSLDRKTKDVFALARSASIAAVEIFQVREGNLEGRRHFFLQHVGISQVEEIYSQIISQYYAQPVDVPPSIIIEKEPEDKELLIKWLEKRGQHEVAIRLPENEEEQRLWKMAETNAWLYLKHRDEQLSEELNDEQRAILEDVQNRLELSQLPLRIECYDISNISGQDAVGSRVVFTNGLPDKKQYRKYKIKSVSGVNDFAMMQEVLFRRLKRMKEEQAQVPDLLVVDGGAGQLSAGLKVLEELNLTHIPMIGLAKKFEEIYQPESNDPLRLPKTSETIQLLTKIRDEAHRFAITYHRKLRSKRLHTSLLDQVTGLGPTKKRQLLRQIGSVEAILDTDINELIKINGITQDLAMEIKRVLKRHL